MVKADYYRRQADICMRLSLMSDDQEIAGFLLNKAIELMGQANEGDPAGRTVGRNLSISSFRRLLSLGSMRADVSICAEAVPLSVAPLLTSTILTATCVVPCAARWILRAISAVAAPCSSTAAARVEEH